MGQIKHQSDQCRDGSALKSWLDGLWGWLFLAGVFILPFIVLVVVSVPWRVANYKQGAMNRARASLLSALADPPPPYSGTPPWQRMSYGDFQVYVFTNAVVIGGREYRCALATPPWDNQWYQNGRLAVTANHEFIWLDFRRGPKLIPDDYKVSRWQSGY